MRLQQEGGSSCAGYGTSGDDIEATNVHPCTDRLMAAAFDKYRKEPICQSPSHFLVHKKESSVRDISMGVNVTEPLVNTASWCPLVGN